MFAFVEIEEPEGAKKILQKYNGIMIEDKRLVITYQKTNRDQKKVYTRRRFDPTPLKNRQTKEEHPTAPSRPKEQLEEARRHQKEKKDN
jgi:RNA recognition motif-containing protein